MRSSSVALMLRMLVVVLVAAAFVVFTGLPGTRAATPTNEPNRPTSSSRLDNNDDNDNDAQWPDRHLIKQSDKAAGLDAYANDVAASIIPTRLLRRPDLLVERSRLRARGDVDGVARLNAVLSTEAFEPGSPDDHTLAGSSRSGEWPVPAYAAAEGSVLQLRRCRRRPLPLPGDRDAAPHARPLPRDRRDADGRAQPDGGLPTRRLAGHAPSRSTSPSRSRCSTTSSTPRTGCSPCWSCSAPIPGCPGWSRSSTTSSTSRGYPRRRG